MANLSLEHLIAGDFENFGKEAEAYFEKKVTRANNLGFLYFCVGLVALIYSYTSFGAVLLLVAFHFDVQSSTYHVELMMTKYHRAMAQLINKQTPD